MFKRFSFAGQTCDAVKRVIVHKSIHDKLVEKLQAAAAKIRLGDPSDESTTMGPLVSKRQLNTLMSQVDDSKAAGARPIIGGKQPDNLRGAYYLPTILTGVTPKMRVWKEEVFGPVLPVVPFSTETEAIRLANDTPYGLGSQVYTADKERALRVAAEIKAGGVDVNGAPRFKPFNPFGGYKASGIGREHGVHGFRELCQIKLVSQIK